MGTNPNSNFPAIIQIFGRVLLGQKFDFPNTNIFLVENVGREGIGGLAHLFMAHT